MNTPGVGRPSAPARVAQPEGWETPGRMTAPQRRQGSLGPQVERRSPPRLLRDRVPRPGLVRPSIGAESSLGWLDSDAETSTLGMRHPEHLRNRQMSLQQNHNSPRAPTRQDRISGREKHSSRNGRPSFEGGPMGPMRAADTSLSVVCDELEANNSGLLGHTPLLHKDAAQTAGDSPSVLKAQNPRSSRVGVGHDDGDQVSDQPTSSFVTQLRRWMHDALRHNLFDTAIFYGDKILSLELSDEVYQDAYWLAYAYFISHQYQKAVSLLTAPLPTSNQASSGSKPPVERVEDVDALAEALAGTHESAMVIGGSASVQRSKLRSGKRKERSFTVSGAGSGSEEGVEEVEPTANGSSQGLVNQSLELATHPATSARTDTEEKWITDSAMCLEEIKSQPPITAEGPCLISYSQACRYLAAQCLVRMSKYYEALDLLGRDASRWRGSAKEDEKNPSFDGGIKLVSSACHLRGLIYMRLDNLDLARENFMKALSLDVKNYDAFSALLDGALLSADRIWDFIQQLQYNAQSLTTHGAAERKELEFVRCLYVVRLPKQTQQHIQQSAEARRQLAEDFGLGLANAEVLLGLAEQFYSHLRYEDAYVVTSRIMDLSPDHQGALPIHIGCMYHVERLHPALFLLAHRLVDTDPENSCSWYAIGAWYASTGRWSVSRRYFSKASLLDPRFAPSWIAFAHSFSFQGESDQAVIAYSTAARKFQESHLPKLFIGMEHIHQGNFHLAKLFFDASAQLLPNDPLCLNELGVVAFKRGEYQNAKRLFSEAMALATSAQEPGSAWTDCLINLAHAQRCSGDVQGAEQTYLSIFKMNPHDATAYLGLAIVQLERGDIEGCITSLHESLAINPRDMAATALLNGVLDELAATSVSRP